MGVWFKKGQSHYVAVLRDEDFILSRCSSAFANDGYGGQAEPLWLKNPA